MWQREFDKITGEVSWVRVPMTTSKFSKFTNAKKATSYSGSAAGFRDTSPGRDLSASAAASEYEKKSLLWAAKSPMRSASFDSGRNASQDSFGDAALMSNSPGFTSVFSQALGLQWERVDSHKSYSLQQPLLSKENNPEPWSSGSLSSARPSLAGRSSEGSGVVSAIDRIICDVKDATRQSYVLQRNPLQEQAGYIEDLETIAAATFSEKQEWFMDQMARLQKPWAEGCIILEINRQYLLEDSHDAVVHIDHTDLHKWIRIVFVNEPGIDAGGIEREWFHLCTQQLLLPATGLFVSSSGDPLAGTYHINPLSGLFNKDHASYFRFAGRLLGKAVMEQHPIPATLSLPIRKQMLLLPITFSDLEFVDIDVYRNLLWLRDHENVEQLSLDFTVTYEALGKSQTFELVPGGSCIDVTDENKDEYLELRLRHRMLDSVKVQLEHLLIGLYEVVSPDVLSVFDYQELELLLCGVPAIDLDDWRRHTDYLGEYSMSKERHKVIKWFWMAVGALDDEGRVRLLQFVTGCCRLPAQGFKALQSNDGKFRRFNIQSVSKADCLYPRAHTCFNKIDLPLYSSLAELEAHLSVVINMECTGFSME